MKNNPLVSIVVPVYNVEKLLNKCVDSILNQTYEKIELILINDGSKDKSFDVMQEYKKDNRVKIYTQENKGASATRNRGISLSKGKYIVFIDSDDFVDLDYIEKMVIEIEDNDVVVSGYKRYSDEKLICEKKPQKTFWSIFKFNSTCGKLYKREFLLENNIKFPLEFKIGEDLYFTSLVVSKKPKIKFIDYAGYDNYANTNSITNTVNTNKSNRNKKMYDLVISLDDIFFDSYLKGSKSVLFLYLKTSIFHLLTQRYILDRDDFFEEYQLYFEYLRKVNKKYGYKRLNFYWQKGEEFKVNLICNIFVLFNSLHVEKILLNFLQNSNIGRLK